MLKNLNLQHSYTTQSADIIKEFYIPVFNEAENYDRATGYFSSGILKLYSKGLEYFKNKNGKIRFIMSYDLSESDFLEMKEGYDNIQKRAENQFWDDKDIESREISNLAYLIETGIVDIKIAFMTKSKGIYHSKFGIFYDKENNLFFSGSNNETYNATQSNAERFDITIDWAGPSPIELSRIKDAKEEFNRTWNNNEDGVLTINPSKVFLNKIISFNKGKLIYENEIIKNNSVWLDFNDVKNLEMKFNIGFNKILETDYFYIKKIKYLVKNVYEDRIDLIDEMESREINELIKNMKVYSNSNFFEFHVSNEVTNFIDMKDLEINKRYNNGIDIKLKNKNVLTEFKSFEKIINELMVRKLREQQMWDAFFGFIMQKSFNFSVPGSGKTSVVLAIFAFLKHKKNIKKILMIGPLSSFKSWKDEFYFCFNKKPKVLNLSEYDGAKEKNRQLKNSLYENFDLIFINHHSLDSCKESIKEILDNTFVVLDESHKVKSNTGKWSKACVDALKEANHMILLTGTPIPNGISDLYMQLQILFKKDYNWFFKWDYNELKNMENLDSFNKKINPFFCRTTKNDLLVPKANEDIIKNILMSNDEENLFKLIYKEFKNSNPLEFIIRCMQASSNPKLLKTKISNENFNGFKDEEDEINKGIKNNDISNKTVSVNLQYSSKFIECVNFVKELSQKGKIIILWCIFIETMNDFLEFLNKENVSCRIINGTVEQAIRENIIDDFQKKKFSVLIANPNTIAESVSLHQNCHDAIYYEYSYNLTHLIQSKDRIHRLGLENDVQTNYYFFCLTNNNEFNSIDSIIYDRLKEKELEMLEVIENKEITSTITNTNENDWKDIIAKMIYK